MTDCQFSLAKGTGLPTCNYCDHFRRQVGRAILETVSRAERFLKKTAVSVLVEVLLLIFVASKPADQTADPLVLSPLLQLRQHPRRVPQQGLRRSSTGITGSRVVRPEQSCRPRTLSPRIELYRFKSARYFFFVCVCPDSAPVAFQNAGLLAHMLSFLPEIAGMRG